MSLGGWASSLACLSLVAALAACPGDGAAGDPGGDAGSADGSAVVSDAAAQVDAGGQLDAAPESWVQLTAPAAQSEVTNPVEFRWTAGGEVRWVTLEADGWPLHAEPLAVDLGSHVYRFTGVGYERHVVLTGLDADLVAIASDEVWFTPLAPPLVFPLSDEPNLQLSLFDSAGSSASFGSPRSNGRVHAGCDLYWTNDGGWDYQTSYYQYNNDTPIYAVADGVIVDYYYFYQGTNALVVDHGDFTVRYGEVDDGGLPNGLGVGSTVTAGQHIAYMGDLDMSSGTWSMLHFEIYSNDLTGPLTDSTNWTYLNVPVANYQRRGDLMDCGPFLRDLLP